MDGWMDGWMVIGLVDTQGNFLLSWRKETEDRR
jgi:hypothetical protein